MNKAEFMNDEKWGPCDGGPSRTRGSGDVNVKLISGGYTKTGARTNLVFRFYDGAEKKIGNSNYCNFREFEGKIYFRSEPVGKGYKLCRYREKGKNCEMKSTVRDAKHWQDYEGCYNLLFDRSLELYYIEKSKKMK